MAFQNPFFSVAGQKERIANVGQVLGIATGLYNPNKKSIVATTPIKPLNTALQTVANHPYITAGVVAGGITAAKNIPSIVAAKTAGTATAAGFGTSLSTGTKLALAGAAGIAAGSFFGGNNSKPNQTVTPSQNPIQTVTPKQDVTPVQKTSQDTYTINTTYGKDSPITSNVMPKQSTPFDVYAGQETSPSFPVSQEVSPEQTTTTSPNWLTIALIGAGVYFLAKE